ncbi:hypothetical protein Tsubulata_005819 [Turnera subulata]|uniref:Uncharacterized protein n=1 Tax=Turnera subulata TaxID=218843 RepID=A0A9Q0GJ34_9ROSI|nr:hypothetical protein Tsubulata_005819 [Turnera subulata]
MFCNLTGSKFVDPELIQREMTRTVRTLNPLVWSPPLGACAPLVWSPPCVCDAVQPAAHSILAAVSYFRRTTGKHLVFECCKSARVHKKGDTLYFYITFTAKEEGEIGAFYCDTKGAGMHSPRVLMAYHSMSLGENAYHIRFKASRTSALSSICYATVIVDDEVEETKNFVFRRELQNRAHGCEVESFIICPGCWQDSDLRTKQAGMPSAKKRRISLEALKPAAMDVGYESSQPKVFFIHLLTQAFYLSFSSVYILHKYELNSTVVVG